ncbi:MFS transporter [Bacillus gobiensis]|uniref:MFS transporter n=1 Tax=Bacillus gobiensis TaxID=1441095 RepID=UPI003D24A5DC
MKNLIYDLKKIPINVWFMIFVYFSISLAKFMVLPFIALFFLRSYSLTSTEIGILLGASPLAALCFGFFGGIIADRLGVKVTLIFSLIVTGLCYIAFALVDVYTFLILISLVTGVTWNLQNVSIDSYISSITPSEQITKVFGYKYWALNLGGALGPLLGAYLGSGRSSFPLFILSIILIIIAIWIKLLNFKEIEEFEKNDMSNETKKKMNLKDIFHTLIHDKALILLSVATVCAFMIESQINANMIQFLENSFPNGVQLLAELLFISTITIVILQPLITHVSDKLKSQTVLFVGSVLYLCGPLIFLFATQRWEWYIAMMTLSIGEMILVPREQALLSKIAKSEMRSTYFSIGSISSNLGFTLGPVVGGVLLDLFSGKGLFAFMFSMALIYGSLLFIVNKFGLMNSSREKSKTTSV